MASVPEYLQCSVDLQPYNSLSIKAVARYFACVESISELLEITDWCQQQGLPLLVLGEGSNIVLQHDWPGLVLRFGGSNVDLLVENEHHVILRVEAGMAWHELVLQTSRQGWHGLENLALIPGTVGAAPVQNIGAYGVELARFVEAVEAFDRHTRSLVHLSRAQCQFNYRDSVFKQQGKDRYVIVAVHLTLSKRFEPVLSYPALRAVINTETVTPEALIAAVVEIRQSKLPDPKVTPNAGSFFKNPLVDADHLASLLDTYPDMPHYPSAEGLTKLAAGWLIEQTGWKGRGMGPVAMHDKQALVMINTGGGTGEDVLALAAAVAEDVSAKFAVTLEIEPRCVGG
jgi:UDP-N-acetylmuramate dehydrogenase